MPAPVAAPQPVVPVSPTPAPRSQPPAREAPPALPGDALALTTPNGSIPAATTALTDRPAEAEELGPVVTERSPWAVKSITVSYGLMPWNRYADSDVHINNPGAGTDLTIQNAAAHDRPTFGAFTDWPRGYPQLDEPQFVVGAGLQFENRTGLELNVKHNKYVVTAGGDPDQTLRMHGTWQGKAIDGERSLQGLIPEYQITKGNHQISVMGTYTAPILTQANGNELSWTGKAGPSLYVGYTMSTLPGGEHTIKPFTVQGFGGTVENTLSYRFANGFALNASHSLSAARLTNATIADGSRVTQTIGASQVTLGVSQTFNL